MCNINPINFFENNKIYMSLYAYKMKKCWQNNILIWIKKNNQWIKNLIRKSSGLTFYVQFIKKETMYVVIELSAAKNNHNQA